MADPILEIAPGLYALKPSIRGLKRGTPEFRSAKTALSTWHKWLRRREIINYLGGKCSRCGFIGHMGCLHVHHTDPAQKTRPRGTDTIFQVGRVSGPLRDTEKRELDACELLCGNCHALESVGSSNEYLRFVHTTTATVGAWDKAWNEGSQFEETSRREVRPALAEGKVLAS